MKTIPLTATAREIRERMLKTAQRGYFDGTTATYPYMEDCKWFVSRIGAVVILTKDTGYHSCGWWKNPDYERCYHVSISYPSGTNFKHTEWLLNEVFGESRKLMWCEPPYSQGGKEKEVYHYRLFCDSSWKPIHPRGEVYSTQFTEIGWKSFSEIHKK